MKLEGSDVCAPGPSLSGNHCSQFRIRSAAQLGTQRSRRAIGLRSAEQCPAVWRFRFGLPFDKAVTLASYIVEQRRMTEIGRNGGARILSAYGDPLFG